MILPIKIGDRGDQRRPGFGRTVGIGAIVAAWMKAQAAADVQSRNAARPQVGLGDRARDRLRHGEEPACRFGRATGGGRRDRCRIRLGRGRLRKRAPRRGRREVDKTAAEADEVEQIAMLAGGGIGPFAGGALRCRTAQADEQAAARRVGDIADQPVAALAMAVGEIVAAHRLGIARETVGQFGGVRRHGLPAARSVRRTSG